MMLYGQLFRWLSVPVLNETVFFFFFFVSPEKLSFCIYTVFALRGRYTVMVYAVIEVSAGQ